MANRVRRLKDILWCFVLMAVVSAVFRLWFGLGATTNLSDAFPWGIWKILNMVAGVALSTSGFTVGFLVYVLGLERYRPLVKPAILIAFLGYGCSCLALLFDIGLPFRFWHPILMWNETSFLFEVFWCVLLYFTVTAIENSPIFLEKLGFSRVSRFLHRIAFVVVAFGISLSCLHHSSLGSIFLVTPQRLHPLWYSRLLPVFFFMSAVGGGLMVVVLARIFYAYWYNPEPVFGVQVPDQMLPAKRSGGQVELMGIQRVKSKDMPMLIGLASISCSILGLYFSLKIGDLIVSGKIPILLGGSWESWLLAFELLIAVLVPSVLMMIPAIRRSPRGLAFIAFCAAAGLALNRLDVGIFGYFRDADGIYFPSMLEWTLSLGVIAGAILIFMLCVENFPFFEERPGRITEPQFVPGRILSTSLNIPNIILRKGLYRWTLIAVFTVPVAWVGLYPPYFRDRQADRLLLVQQPLGIDPLRTMLRIDGDRRGLFTDFPHADHQNRLGNESSCKNCHHIALPEDKSTPCSRCHRNMTAPTLIFDHTRHMVDVAKKEKLSGWHPENYSCSFCHALEQPKAGGTRKSCWDCHRDDMTITDHPKPEKDFEFAPSFQAAMHKTCIPCHKREANRVKRPTLAECSTCHQSLRSREFLMAPLRQTVFFNKTLANRQSVESQVKQEAK